MAIDLGRTDVILSMKEPWMQYILDGHKTYEFRKYLICPTVKRIWFYRVKPHQFLDYVCEVEPARKRDRDPPLEEKGLGNEAFNNHDKDFEGYDYAYKILSVYKVDRDLSLSELTAKFGFRAAPQGKVYATPAIIDIWNNGEVTKIR